ncbi:MAG: hypothetical protein J5688_06815, partial [Paludibacteraceae bacterium]|nr:hypothetical protein [Paludibacteraceae bacterium]
MKLEVELLLKEYDTVLSGYAMLLDFRLINLPVKADAITLLPAVIHLNGEDKKLEEVAGVGLRADDVLDIYPYHEDLILPIGQAITDIHPEYRQEVKTLHVDDRQEDFKYLSLTIPEVDQPRHDLLLQGVDACADVTNTQTEAAKALYTVKLQKQLFERPDD